MGVRYLLCSNWWDKSTDAEVQEFVTGVLWNLFPCDVIKTTINQGALLALINTVNVPVILDGIALFHFDDHKIKFQTLLVLSNMTGCQLHRGGSEEAMWPCEVLVNSLLYGIHTSVSTYGYNTKIVVSCICTPMEPVQWPSGPAAGPELTGCLTRKRLSQQGLGSRMSGEKEKEEDTRGSVGWSWSYPKTAKVLQRV